MLHARYRIHGRILDSAIELPDLPRAEDDAALDVTLTRARVPRAIANPVIEGACFQAAPGELLIWREGTARFHVRDGRRIEVEADAAVPADVLTHLLLSAPWAGLALQAGELPLHASAIATARGAAIFLGRATAGKSTLALAGWRCGARVFADDLVVLRVTEESAVIGAGLPRVRLWPDMLAAFALPAYATLPAENDRRVVICDRDSALATARVAAIYLLERGPERGSAAVTGAEAIWALLDGVFRPAFVRGLRSERVVLAQITALVRTTPVRRLTLPAGNTAPMEIAARVVEELGA